MAEETALPLGDVPLNLAVYDGADHEISAVYANGASGYKEYFAADSVFQSWAPPPPPPATYDVDLTLPADATPGPGRVTISCSQSVGPPNDSTPLTIGKPSATLAVTVTPAAPVHGRGTTLTAVLTRVSTRAALVGRKVQLFARGAALAVPRVPVDRP